MLRREKAPGLSPAFSFVLRRVHKSGPNPPQHPSAGQRLYPAPKEGTQCLTAGHAGRSLCSVPGAPAPAANSSVPPSEASAAGSNDPSPFHAVTAERCTAAAIVRQLGWQRVASHPYLCSCAVGMRFHPHWAKHFCCSGHVDSRDKRARQIPAAFVSTSRYHEVPVIQFCFGFCNRHVLSALSHFSRSWAKAEKNSFMCTQALFNPTKSTRPWIAAAYRPERPRWLPPVPGQSHQGRIHIAPPLHPWPSPRKQGPGAGTPVHRGS